MTTLRRLMAGGACAAVFVGCLFPSFDNLKNNDVAPARDDNRGDDDDSGEDGGRSSTSSGSPGTSSSSSSASSSSSGAIADTGADAFTTPKPVIRCGGQTCDAVTQFCCDSVIDGTSCKSTGASCDLWKFACDDFKDCPSGQICCRPDMGSLQIVCAAPSACNGGQDIFCQPNGLGCAPGTGTCTNDELTGPPGVDVRLCK